MTEGHYCVIHDQSLAIKPSRSVPNRLIKGCELLCCSSAAMDSARDADRDADRDVQAVV